MDMTGITEEWLCSNVAKRHIRLMADMETCKEFLTTMKQRQ